jgi:hypothetical protein
VAFIWEREVRRVAGSLITALVVAACQTGSPPATSRDHGSLSAPGATSVQAGEVSADNPVRPPPVR